MFCVKRVVLFVQGVVYSRQVDIPKLIKADFFQVSKDFPGLHPICEIDKQ